jgi:hypothetical protein
MYDYLDIVPEVTTSIIEKVSFFDKDKPKSIAVKVKAGKDNIKGYLQLELPTGWNFSPKSIPFHLDKKGKEQIVYFNISPPTQNSETTVKCVAIVNNKRYDKEQTIIEYDHIAKQQVLLPSEAKFNKLDIKINNEKIV